MAKTARPISSRLNERREKLGLSCAVLARRVGLSLRSVQRILSGEQTNPGFAAVTALARELGLGVLLQDEVDIRTMRHRQAERKAAKILALVQGTSALEAQGLKAETIRELREKTVHELLAGSPRKLWAD